MRETSTKPARSTNLSRSQVALQPPWCSVIIPTLNEAAVLPALLEQLRPYHENGSIEIIVADGGSEDGTLGIARRSACTPLLCTRGRARQMNAGASVAIAHYYWFLHADTTLPGGWHEKLVRAGETQLPASFSVRFAGAKKFSLLALYGWMSELAVTAFRFGDQSLLVPARLFKKAGGYREDMEILEDNDLIRRLKSITGKIVLMDGYVTTSARRYHRYGVAYTQANYVGLYFAYRLGMSNTKLLGWYRRAFS